MGWVSPLSIIWPRWVEFSLSPFSHFLPRVSGGLALPFFRSLPPPVFLSWGTPTHCALMRSCTVICAWEASSVQCFPLFRSLYLSLLCIMMMHCQELTTSSSLPLLSFFFIPSHSPLSFAFTYAVFASYKVNYSSIFTINYLSF